MADAGHNGYLMVQTHIVSLSSSPGVARSLQVTPFLDFPGERTPYEFSPSYFYTIFALESQVIY